MTKLCFMILITVAAIASASAATAPWAIEQDSALAFKFTYPRDLFHRTPGDGKPSFHYFVSRDSDAKFMVGAWDNKADQTPGEFKRWLMANTGGYDAMTYVPRGRSWFVLSGYRGDAIYYEKVMFSCAGRIVNVLAMTYPKGLRHLYDPVVEQMEDSFRPSSRCPA
jgi:hypothetical protein